MSSNINNNISNNIGNNIGNNISNISNNENNNRTVNNGDKVYDNVQTSDLMTSYTREWYEILNILPSLIKVKNAIQNITPIQQELMLRFVNGLQLQDHLDDLRKKYDEKVQECERLRYNYDHMLQQYENLKEASVKESTTNQKNKELKQEFLSILNTVLSNASLNTMKNDLNLNNNDDEIQRLQEEISQLTYENVRLKEKLEVFNVELHAAVKERDMLQQEYDALKNHYSNRISSTSSLSANNGYFVDYKIFVNLVNSLAFYHETELVDKLINLAIEQDAINK